MIIKKRKEIDKSIIEKLANETNLSQFVVELLLIRGVDSKEKIQQFFNNSYQNLTSPFVIKDMEKAVTFVKEAVKNNKRILIYGDYDCDGVTSTAVLLKYFRHIGYKVDYYLPDRDLEGYGLSETSINNFMIGYRPEVIITVDCGISNYKEVELLKSKYNVDVLVTDHHQLAETLPDTIVINPKTSQNELRDLAGVGVAYKLVEALAGADFAKDLLDIVAIGTIADLVELKGENRLIVKLGLELLNQNKIKGISAIKNQIKKFDDLTEGDIAFLIAPMINSVGRMDNANSVVDMLLSSDNFYLSTTACKLERLNNERKFLCDAMYEDVISTLKDYDFSKNKAIVLHSRNWKTGILGIVASRISEEYNLPTILFGGVENTIKGSARTAGGIDLYKMLSTFREDYISFGGHSGAAGLSIYKQYLPKLLDNINNYIVENSLIKNLYPSIIYDVKIDKINREIYTDIKKLQPFGMGNPTPKFLMENNGGFSVFASNHIKKTEGSEVIAFNEADSINNYNNKSTMLVKITENNFRGETKYQGIVEKNYLSSVVKESDEYVLDYYKNLLYKTRDIKVNYIDDYSFILNNTDSLFGTIFITYSAKTYNTFANVILNLPKYKYKYFLFDIKNRSSKPPYNRLVLSPSKNFDFSGYKNIVFVETPLNMVYYNNIDNCSVVNDNYAFIDAIKNTKIDRDFLIEVYTLIKFSIKAKDRVNNIDELYNLLKNGYGLECSFLEFSLAFYIFFELGFLTITSDFSLLLTTNKKPLEQSKIFTAILENKNVWN